MKSRALLRAAALLLALSTPLAAEPIRVTGRVLDGFQESGVAGARIELLPAYQGSSGTPAPVASARTDAEGSFEIAAPEDGCFRLVVRGEGYLTMEHPLAPLVEDRQLSTANLVAARPSEAMGEEVRASRRRPWGSDRPWGWRLADKNETPTPKADAATKPVPPRRISGKVTDSASGKPVAGALVWSGWPLVAPPARTDGEGRFHLDVPNVPPEEGVWLESGAAGYLPANRQYARPGATEPVLVKLGPAAEISGKVSDPAGRPVAGASVQVSPPRAIDKGDDFSGAWVGPDGRFRLLGLKPGSAYKLTARRKGFERTSVPARTTPTGQPPPPPVQIVLGQGKTAVGRVVDAAGRPAAEVKVVLIDSQTYRDQQEATTNEEGRFEIRHLSPGTYRLTVYHPERPELEVPEVEIPATTPSVNLGDLKLPADGAIEGRVMDSRGKPVEGAEVHVTEAQNLETAGLSLGEGPWSAPSLRSLRTGADGSFHAKGFKSGSFFDLRVQHPAYAETTVHNVAVPTRDPVRIEMKASHSLRGQVVNAEGAPVAGASLAWIGRGEGIAGLLGSRRPLGTTDAQGHFEASGLPAGSLDLEVSAEGYQTRWVEALNIPEDRDLEDVRVVLGRGSWLDVQVLNTEGEPVPDVSLLAHPQNLFEQENPLTLLRKAFSDCTTDSQGRCRLNLPEPGAYAVQVVGKTPFNLTVPPGGTSFEIRLPRGFEVSGRVIGKDGAGVPGLHVQSWSQAQEPSGIQTGPDGTFVFPELAEGQYRLTAQQPGVGEASLDVEVAGRPVRGLELRFGDKEPGIVLTGRLTGLPPESFKGAFVQAASPEDYTLSDFVKWDGSYRIEDLEPGEWTVSARTDSGRQASGKVWIEPGATAATLDLDFSGGLTLSGRVLVDGSPLGGASVLAGNLADPGSGQLGSTAHDGSFTLRGLPPGSLTVIVLGSPGISASRTVELAEDEEIAIEITTGTFKATVLSATGEPLEGAVATLELQNSEAQNPFGSVNARSGPDGTLDAGRLAPGTYRLKIHKEGFQPREETVEIHPGGGTVVEVRLAARE